ncbi:MAG: AraC family transcriptional regulator [Bauldia sp.]
MSGRRTTTILESFHYLPDPLWANVLMSVPRAGKIEAGPDYQIERTSSPGQDLLFCVAGCGSITVNGVTTPVRTGDLAWLPGEAPHGHAADAEDPWTLYWLRVDGGDIAAIRSTLVGPDGGVIPISRGVTLVGWFGRLFECMRARAPGCDLALNVLMAELMAMLHGEGLAQPNRQLPASVTRLTAAMSARPGDAWTEDEMKDVARVSAAHFRRQFRAHFHMTPREWLRRERIMLAQDLLGRPDASVTSIADTCGFYDIYHFSREFRRVVGQSPTEWRKAGAVKSLDAATPVLSR